jgi:tetratricopeptide (TPR) repeat protein
MSGCNDKRFEQMLHAFEIGILTDHDREEFQLHLFDCQHCYEQASRMEEAIALLRTDSDLQEIPRTVVEDRSNQRPSEQETPRPKSSTGRTLIPTSLVAAAVIILLVLKPWQIEFKPTELAVAAENRLAIIDFKNLANPDDPDMLGKITANLLIADLSESQYLNVVSSQRLDAIARLLEKEGPGTSDSGSAMQIAARSGAKWMLSGSLIQIEPRIILTCEIADVATGDLIATQRMTSDDGDDLFSTVDKLTVRIKNDLALPLAAQSEPDQQVAKMTSHSPSAYRHYLAGVANYNRYYNAEALESFRKALQIDSTMAMAYYYISLILDTRSIENAILHLDHASSRDRNFIRSREAFLAGDFDLAIRLLQEIIERNPDDKEALFRTGLCHAMLLEFEAAIRYYQRAVEVDPLDKMIYNQMAYTYDWMGELDKSLESIDMYISIAPNEPNPFDSRGDIYSRNGRLTLAIASYRNALKIKPDFWASLFKLGRNYLFEGELDTADSCFAELAECSDPTWRYNGLAARAYVPIYLGRFDKAVNLLDEAIAVVVSEQGADNKELLHHLKGVVLGELSDHAGTLMEIETSIRIHTAKTPSDKTYNRHLAVQRLAETGSLAEAGELAERLGKVLSTKRDSLRHSYALGFIAYAEGDLQRAVERFERAAEDTVIPYTPANFMLGQVYVESGRFADGIAELDKLRSDFTENRLVFGSLIVRSHYLRGIAYEGLNQYDLAIEQYRIFVDIWAQADAGRAEVLDAKARLDRLESSS